MCGNRDFNFFCVLLQLQFGISTAHQTAFQVEQEKMKLFGRNAKNRDCNFSRYSLTFR